MNSKEMLDALTAEVKSRPPQSLAIALAQSITSFAEGRGQISSICECPEDPILRKALDVKLDIAKWAEDEGLCPIAAAQACLLAMSFIVGNIPSPDSQLDTRDFLYMLYRMGLTINATDEGVEISDAWR